MFLSRELLHCGLITLGKGLNGIHTLNILFLKLGDVERERATFTTHTLGSQENARTSQPQQLSELLFSALSVYSSLWFCSQAQARFHSIKRTFFPT